MLLKEPAGKGQDGVRYLWLYFLRHVLPKNDPLCLFLERSSWEPFLLLELHARHYILHDQVHMEQLEIVVFDEADRSAHGVPFVICLQLGLTPHTLHRLATTCPGPTFSRFSAQA